MFVLQGVHFDGTMMAGLGVNLIDLGLQSARRDEDYKTILVHIIDDLHYLLQLEMVGLLRTVSVFVFVADAAEGEPVLGVHLLVLPLHEG